VSAGRFEVYDTGDGYGFRLFFVVVDKGGHALATSEAHGTALERDMAMTTTRLLAIACPIIVRRASAAQ